MRNPSAYDMSVRRYLEKSKYVVREAARLMGVAPHILYVNLRKDTQVEWWLAAKAHKKRITAAEAYKRRKERARLRALELEKQRLERS